MGHKYEWLIETVLFVNSISLFVFIRDNIFIINKSEGESMVPTLPDTSVILIDRFFYKYTSGIRKNDIVIAYSPMNSDYDICKRVSHTEGEMINDYLKVPQGHVWLEGDNKEGSFDSRHHGPISNHLIKGKVLFMLYPFKSIS